MRVGHLLCGRQHLPEERIHFALVAAAVIATDGMVVRDGAAVRDDGLVGGELDVPPGRKRAGDIAIRSTGGEGEVGRWAIRVEVREAAGQPCLLAGRARDRAS